MLMMIVWASWLLMKGVRDNEDFSMMGAPLALRGRTHEMSCIWQARMLWFWRVTSRVMTQVRLWLRSYRVFERLKEKEWWLWDFEILMIWEEWWLDWSVWLRFDFDITLTWLDWIWTRDGVCLDLSLAWHWLDLFCDEECWLIREVIH